MNARMDEISEENKQMKIRLEEAEEELSEVQVKLDEAKEDKKKQKSKNKEKIKVLKNLIKTQNENSSEQIGNNFDDAGPKVTVIDQSKQKPLSEKYNEDLCSAKCKAYWVINQCL